MSKREILFKAKRIDNGEWIEGFPYWGEYTGAFILQNKPVKKKNARTGDITLSDEVVPIAVDGSTICQYTGLADSDGKKVFEGDVLNAEDEIVGKNKFIVRFGKCGGVKNTNRLVGYYGFFFEGYDELTKKHISAGLRDDPVFWLTGSFCEVIWNIHDKEAGK